MRITTKFAKRFCTILCKSERRNWANLSWTKIALEHAGFAGKEGKVQPTINGCNRYRVFRHGTNLRAENHTSTALGAFSFTPNVAS